MKRTAIFAGKTTDADHLAKIVQDRGELVVGVYGAGRHRSSWRDLANRLDTLDQIVVADVGDIPVRSLSDFVATVARLHDQDVSLYVAGADIDTLSSAQGLLRLMISFKQAKRSKAIRKGQERAAAAGKKVGRPEVQPKLRQRIADAVAAGGGIRPIARRFGVSPGTVINISRTTQQAMAQAA